jgi:hypothetical protein
MSKAFARGELGEWVEVEVIETRLDLRPPRVKVRAKQGYPWSVDPRFAGVNDVYHDDIFWTNECWLHPALVFIKEDQNG